MLRLSILPVLLALLITAPPALAASPREVKVTSDSEPGWVPTEAQVAEALSAQRVFFVARDRGDTARAYAMLHPIQAGTVAQVEFDAQLVALNAAVGAVRERQVRKVTWTRYHTGGRAPIPGVYAAIDIVGRFENAQRYCGYVVLHQPLAGGPFLVMRTEENFVPDDAAAQITAQQGRPALDVIWTELSASCPGGA